MIPILLCGGSGTRLWPVSRSKMPKQFISLLEQSLFELSANRLQRFGQPYVVAVREFEALTMTFASRLGLPADHVLSEPCARNTAAAVALICRYLEMRGHGAEVAAVFPADHVIADEKKFEAAVGVAVEKAREGGVVTLGIRPTEPSTGFGYIELESASVSNDRPEAVRSLKFREKPDLETAKAYVASGKYCWNAGIFFFKVSELAMIFAKQAPDIWKVLVDLKPDLSNLEALYAQLPSISFDYAIMEKLESQFCVPCDIGWSDLGSWDDVVGFAESDDSPKVPNQAVTFESGSKNCFGYSESRKTIAFVDVENVVAVDTPDAMLVYRRGSSQNVRYIVDQMRKAGRFEVEEHNYELKSWGRLEVLREGKTSRASLVTVNKGQELTNETLGSASGRRDERWTILMGEADFTTGRETVRVTPGSVVSIAASSSWRLVNVGLAALEFVEVRF